MSHIFCEYLNIEAPSLELVSPIIHKFIMFGCQ